MREDLPGHRWADIVRGARAELAREHPIVVSSLGTASVFLHGSTTRGVDDAYSDLDVWLLPTRESPRQFIEFRVSNKPGQMKVESRRDFETRIRGCDLPLIFEVRDALLVLDADSWGHRIIDLARREMTEQIRQVWFAYHYIEMRSEHRSCDNLIERRDEAALLLAMASTLSHALRAAMVLDGQPYPYTKWLAVSAATTTTGGRIVPIVNDVIGLIEAGELHRGGPEQEHPINLKLRQIRQVLIGAARSGGLDEPWLTEWWLHLGARDRIRQVAWG